MEDLMHRIGVLDWELFKSGTDGYPLCLSKANLCILQKQVSLQKPILILEDDVEWNGQYEIEVPDDVDSIYLGFSKYAGSPFINECLPEGTYAKFSRVPNYDDLFRVVNTLTTHAIVFVSERFRRFCIEEYGRLSNFTKKINGSMHQNDVYFSRYQRFFNVQSPKRPFFQQSKLYQTNFLDHVEKATNFLIDNTQVDDYAFTMHNVF